MKELAMLSIAAVVVLTLLWAWKKPGSRGQETRVKELRQNLRVKALYDEAKIDRLIKFEQDERAPKGQKPGELDTLLNAAIERWERDKNSAASLY
ncbi:MAG TPA: hypothetical protein VGK29_02245 [Paludibaculum sp.]|jgi:hypothetical protein